MQEDIKQIVREAIVKIIQDTTSESNVRRAVQLHEMKVHFVPAKYRVLGGLLQSLNIKFGNFIEKLIALVVEKDSNVEALPESGGKVKFSMTARTDSLIDQYITSRQLPGSPDQCDDLFENLLKEIINTERQGDANKQIITKDVDALFKTNQNQIIYLEIKYNDDHDTGKFVDINRKFIKTYAGLINHLGIEDISDIKPILYYLNPIKRWGPIYVPSSHIYRGRQLFDEYFEIRYEDVDEYLRNLSDDESIMAIFDELYQSIRYDAKHPDLL